MSDLSIFYILNWLVMFVTLMILTIIFKDLSKKLGEALQIKKYYLLYYLCVGLIILSMVLIFIEYIVMQNGDSMPGLEYVSFAARLVFLLSVMIEAAITLKYWGWLIPEVIGSRRKKHG